MNPGHKEARALIAFYLDAGADALLGEQPVDRMADERSPPAPAGLQTPSPSRKAATSGTAPAQGETLLQAAAPASPEAAAMAARQAARTAASLDELRELLT